MSDLWLIGGLLIYPMFVLLWMIRDQAKDTNLRLNALEKDIRELLDRPANANVATDGDLKELGELVVRVNTNVFDRLAQRLDKLEARLGDLAFRGTEEPEDDD